ncbi:MAG: HesA/MoeB/ThiF family protein [Candidatus Bathyarchaeia archaeon]
MEELGRYARHHLIDWWDQEKLASSRILIAGAGALGNEVAKNLTLVGVGHLTIVDFDTIEISNLTRTALFRESDLGKGKAETLAQRCHELSPNTETEWIHGDVELDLGSWAYKDFDIVLGCLDSIDARLALNARCLQAGVPWINGGMGAISGEVSIFTKNSPCFQCTMSPDMWKRRNQRFSCGWLKNLLPEKKVGTTATISSLVGAIMAQESLVMVHEMPVKKSGLLPGYRLFLQVKPYSLSIAELTRDQDCTAHDTLPALPTPIESSVTASELMHIDGAYVEMNIDMLKDVTCQPCGQKERILKPAKRFDVSLLTCPTCGGERKAEIFNVLDQTMTDLFKTPLSAFSLPRLHVISVRDENERKYFVVGAK